MSKKTFTVEYACDSIGDHTADYIQCIETGTKEFTSIKKAMSFANKCSYVYNLDELLESIPATQIPSVSKYVTTKFSLV